MATGHFAGKPAKDGLRQGALSHGTYSCRSSPPPGTYSTRLQRLEDDQGRIFASDQGLKDEGNPTYTPISDLDLNPGIAARVLVEFPIPSGHMDTDPEGKYRLVAHGSAGSPGVVMRIALHPD